MNTGFKIKELRIQKGWSQKKLGEECNINEVQIRKYESGKITPKNQNLRRIATALGVGLDTFIKLDLAGGDELARSTEKIRDELLGNTPRTRQEAVVWKKNILLEQYDKLNEEGQTKAVESVENLTYNPKYSKD